MVLSRRHPKKDEETKKHVTEAKNRLKTYFNSDSDSNSNSDSNDSISSEIFVPKSTNSSIMSNYLSSKKSSRIFKNIDLIEELGKGTYGEVYKAKATRYDGKTMDIAVKYIYDIDIGMMSHEIEYSYLMGKNGIGPKVYDAFYTEHKRDDEDVILQVIMMEYFPYDCHYYLKYADVDLIDYLFVIKKMVELLKVMIFDHGMYCMDIKPRNYVMNGKLEVRMIDFGKESCSPEELPTDTEEELFYFLSFQLYYIIEKIITDSEKPDEYKMSVNKYFCSIFPENIDDVVQKYYNKEEFQLKHYAMNHNDDATKYSKSVCSNSS